MTKEEILAMKPGRELDRLIAEKVIGVDFSKIDVDYSFGAPLPQYQICKPYSTDISAAWKMEESLIKKGNNVSSRYTYEVINLTVGGFTAIHATPVTRCIAALLAVMPE